MSDMDRTSEPTLEEVFAGLEKARNAEDKSAPPAPPLAMSEPPSRSQRADTDVFTMGATFKLRSGATQPEQTLEEHARSAMLAAAAAIIQPWLYKNFPRIIEQRLSAQLKERVEPIAAALNQQVADTINQRLEPAVGQRVAAAEEGLATALIQ